MLYLLLFSAIFYDQYSESYDHPELLIFFVPPAHLFLGNERFLDLNYVKNRLGDERFLDYALDASICVTTFRISKCKTRINVFTVKLNVDMLF